MGTRRSDVTVVINDALGRHKRSRENKKKSDENVAVECGCSRGGAREEGRGGGRPEVMYLASISRDTRSEKGSNLNPASDRIPIIHVPRAGVALIIHGRLLEGDATSGTRYAAEQRWGHPLLGTTLTATANLCLCSALCHHNLERLPRGFLLDWRCHLHLCQAQAGSGIIIEVTAVVGGPSQRPSSTPFISHHISSQPVTVVLLFDRCNADAAAQHCCPCPVPRLPHFSHEPGLLMSDHHSPSQNCPYWSPSRCEQTRLSRNGWQRRRDGLVPLRLEHRPKHRAVQGSSRSRADTKREMGNGPCGNDHQSSLEQERVKSAHFDLHFSVL
ncbi:hypothetical protein LIA77_10711 [Sarocladium implicatum]|nr:hypothetical protein LIA77_10711 [Sarocladium implicatum]